MDPLVAFISLVLMPLLWILFVMCLLALLLAVIIWMFKDD